LEEARARLAAHPDLIPEHWRLYHLVPDDVEFWQADHGRRHIRLRYELHADGWTRQLLWP
jgi:pyridoxamine 5'-phosphate oxidase